MKRLFVPFSVVAFLAVASTAVAQQHFPAPGVVGTIETISGGEIVLAGGLLRVDVREAQLAPANVVEELQPGDRVHVLMAPGLPLRALRVFVIDAHELELSGSIEAIDPVESTVTVLGVTFAITESTELRPVLRQEGALSHFRVNEPVTIAGSFEGGRLIAARLASLQIPVAPLVPNPSRPGEIAFEGTITSKDGHIWMISGKRVAVTPRTHVRGKPEVGDHVRVTGLQGRDEVFALTVTKL